MKIATFVKEAMFALILVCGIFATLPATEAYSSGAGGCAGGQPAVGVPHLLHDPINDNTNVTNGTLAQGNLMVLLDGIVLNPSVAASFTIGKDHNLTLVHNSIGYKGLLLRLGGVGTTALSPFTPDTSGQLQVSSMCVAVEGASGVTHTSSIVKRQSSIKLRYDGSVTSSLPLDVTVVIENLNQNSIFFYSGFTLNVASAVASTSAPMTTTAKPAAAPTTKPITPTTKPITRTTVRPFVPTLKPVAPTSKPFKPTAKPAKPTVKPVKPTSKPVKTTTKPVKPTSKPVKPSLRPFVPTRAPFKPASRDVKTTHKPVKPTSKPVKSTSRPV